MNADYRSIIKRRGRRKCLKKDKRSKGDLPNLDCLDESLDTKLYIYNIQIPIPYIAINYIILHINYKVYIIYIIYILHAYTIY